MTITLFLLPALALYCLFVLYPVVQAAHYSLYKWNGLQPLDNFIGLKNYQTRLQQSDLQGAIANNFLIIVLSLLIQIPFSLMLAVLLNRRFPGRAIFRLIFFLPYVLSEAITGIIFLLMLQSGGSDPFVTALIKAVGWAPSPRTGWVTGLRDDHALLHHFVEVLRLPHDHAARGLAGHPARDRGSRADRRRRALAGVPSRHAAASRPHPPRLDLPVDDRRACSSSTWSGS